MSGQGISSSSARPKLRRARPQAALRLRPSLSVFQGRADRGASVPSAGSARPPLHTAPEGTVACLGAHDPGSLSFLPGGQPFGHSLSTPESSGIRGPAGTCLPPRACPGRLGELRIGVGARRPTQPQGLPVLSLQRGRHSSELT